MSGSRSRDSLRIAVGVVLLAFLVVAGGDAAKMPHSRSALSRLPRRARAQELGFLVQRSVDVRHVLVPGVLQTRVKVMSRSLLLHDVHDTLAGSHSHSARAAAVAAFRGGGISHDELNEASRIHRQSNSAKHGGAARWAHTGCSPVVLADCDDGPLAPRPDMRWADTLDGDESGDCPCSASDDMTAQRLLREGELKENAWLRAEVCRLEAALVGWRVAKDVKEVRSVAVQSDSADADSSPVVLNRVLEYFSFGEPGYDAWNRNSVNYFPCPIPSYPEEYVSMQHFKEIEPSWRCDFNKLQGDLRSLTASLPSAVGDDSHERLGRVEDQVRCLSAALPLFQAELRLLAAESVGGDICVDAAPDILAGLAVDVSKLKHSVGGLERLLPGIGDSLVKRSTVAIGGIARLLQEQIDSIRQDLSEPVLKVLKIMSHVGGGEFGERKDGRVLGGVSAVGGIPTCIAEVETSSVGHRGIVCAVDAVSTADADGGVSQDRGVPVRLVWER
mmetsp:Transcript_52733/g.171502  ORF Transcript_52733/g.171502 Transcript_52733/m.171502 type:complete len:502 (+) Transcript_52733:90-1595(+)|eukprot:CAMPEP_0203907062 /NCGR_PEP_ID=MMETSP0359-20131031/48606_1 /ASSEMBLY_ACC=CAM_ASM_000338 /TAXON_ID=268821 /ORGANISM="Scrippsiella Hangoei, Strain SHTV-5" /LENGTH=501 /DNA_ID=CAMNT_0050831819 /DNA_START=71 /DNA_END=1576 /DNA_ORIENTATION=+